VCDAPGLIAFVLAVFLVPGVDRRHLQYLAGVQVYEHFLHSIALDHLDVLADDFAVPVLDAAVDGFAAGTLLGCRDRDSHMCIPFCE
jgi:hypothetical protein